MSVEPHPLGSNRFTSLPPDSVIFGESVAMRELHRRLLRICGTNVPILLQGEGGVGKNLLSRFIHNQSVCVGPYARINYASASGVMFGSDALPVAEGQPGFIAASAPSSVDFSSTGTLFLEEVGELSPELQLKLLQSLNGGHPCEDDIQPNQGPKARIISATTRNLRHEVQEGRFRGELFYRLAVVTLQVPPLRNRLDDLLIIADYLRRRYSESFGLPEKPFPKRLVERMHYYEWPGNIRELENFVCSYVVLGSDEGVLPELNSNRDAATVHGTIWPGEDSLKEVAKRTLAEVERQLMVKALDRHDGNLKKAAHTLGISYRTLMNKMDHMGLPRTRHFTKSQGDQAP